MALGKHSTGKQTPPEQVALDQSHGDETIAGHDGVNHGSVETIANPGDWSAFTSPACGEDSRLSLATFYAYALADAPTPEPGYKSLVAYALGVLVVLVASAVVYFHG